MLILYWRILANDWRATGAADYNKMMVSRRQVPAVVLLCALSCGLTACLARRRLISRAAGTTPTLKVSDAGSLLDAIEHQYAAIQDFSATVDMVPALGSAEKSRITEYKDVRAYIRFRAPAMIRLIGLLPVVRSQAFDMTSDGSSFKLYVPSKNRFIVGRNEIEKPSPNNLENLRPQHFLEALMVRPVDGRQYRVMMENFTDEDNAYYILHEIVETPGGGLRLNRAIWINRIDLRMARQMIFDKDGNILTDARYSEWHVYDNVPFPKHIEINRPRDEYAVVIDLVKMDINKGVPDDQFVLEQPEGTVLQVVGQAVTPVQPPAPPKKGSRRP
jgi:outer membrane lipoprotein-sorting protein